ncbi:unnamed protein product [Somion occarium]|uniref:DUF6535 domain-containing protein n=1 Tax=Somion occarium TaxID=3059160 RepID=A0ABP1D5W4_9APHY
MDVLGHGPAITPPTITTGWAAMDRTVKEVDEVKIRDFKEDIDTLLVLAGLMSAAITTFLVESYKALQPDPNDAIIQLLSQIAAQSIASNNSSHNLPPKSAFVPPSWAIRVNVLWFASLIFSLVTASFGMLVKQWLREFLAANEESTSHQALLRVRFYRYHGLLGWKVFEIVAILPMLLQLALGLFLLGLCFFASSVHNSVARISIPIVSISVSILLAVTLAPAFSPRCPYKTTFLKGPMRSLRKLLSRITFLRRLYMKHSTTAASHLFGGFASSNSEQLVRRPSYGRDGNVPKHSSSGSVEMARSISSSTALLESRALIPFEEEDAAMDDELDIEILLSVGSIQNDDGVLDTLVTKSFLQTQPKASDIIVFVLRVIKHRLQKRIVTTGVPLTLDLRRLTAGAWFVLITVVADTLYQEVQQQSTDTERPPEKLQWLEWMYDALALLTAVSPYVLPQEANRALSSSLVSDPIGSLQAVVSRTPTVFTDQDSDYVVRRLRDALVPLDRQSLRLYAQGLLSKRLSQHYGDDIQDTLRWAEYLQAQLVSFCAERLGFIVVGLYQRQLQTRQFYVVLMLSQTIKHRLHLDITELLSSHSIIIFRNLTVQEWRTILRVAALVVEAEIQQRPKGRVDGRFEWSSTLREAALILFARFDHPISHGGLKAISDCLIHDPVTTVQFVASRVQEDADLNDFYVQRICAALRLCQADDIIGFIKIMLHERLSILTTLLDLPVQSSSEMVVSLVLEICDHLLRKNIGDGGLTSFMDFSSIELKIWDELMEALAMAINKELEVQSRTSPPFQWSIWIEDAITVILSKFTFTLPEKCTEVIGKLFSLDHCTLSNIIVARISDEAAPQGCAFASLLNRLDPVLASLPQDSLFICLHTLLEARFCHDSTHQHSELLAFVETHWSTDITSETPGFVSSVLTNRIGEIIAEGGDIWDDWNQQAASVIFTPRPINNKSMAYVDQWDKRPIWMLDLLLDERTTPWALSLVASRRYVHAGDVLLRAYAESGDAGRLMIIEQITTFLRDPSSEIPQAQPLDYVLLCHTLMRLYRETAVTYVHQKLYQMDSKLLLGAWPQLWLILASLLTSPLLDYTQTRDPDRVRWATECLTWIQESLHATGANMVFPSTPTESPAIGGDRDMDKEREVPDTNVGQSEMNAEESDAPMDQGAVSLTAEDFMRLFSELEVEQVLEQESPAVTTDEHLPFVYPEQLSEILRVIADPGYNHDDAATSLHADGDRPTETKHLDADFAAFVKSGSSRNEADHTEADSIPETESISETEVGSTATKDVTSSLTDAGSDVTDAAPVTETEVHDSYLGGYDIGKESGFTASSNLGTDTPILQPGMVLQV